ncbi:MAG: amidohydrolase family protein [Proteobacteria bacterium]|nr:amidohydrolase family protein [Pseudomonadota bacterium]
MHDLVIQGGNVVDGTGQPMRRTSIAVKDGLIVAVGDDVGAGQRVIDAADLLVTPGFVDIHTHYDGQATWDPYLTPSSWHGVTSCVFGNCSVGFAPVRPDKTDYLINLMEGVEDIPGTVLAEGVSFDWESFPEYLDALESMPRVMNVGAQVPHAALRFYVMGDRGADHEAVPTRDEIEQMGELLESSLRAGALGFTTSRTTKHRAADGRVTPSLSASEAELLGLAAAMKRAGSGVIEVNSDFGPGEFEAMRAAAERSGRPLSCLIVQVRNAPGLWRETMANVRAARAAGVDCNSQVHVRGIGMVMGLETTLNPFRSHAAWQELADLTPDARRARLRQDETLRSRLENVHPQDRHTRWIESLFGELFRLDETMNYEPTPDQSLLANAQRMGTEPWSLLLEWLLADDGEGHVMYPFENYYGGDLEAIREMLTDEASVIGVADGGAHVGVICDAGAPTFMLTHWVRDRTRGPRLPLEFLVAKHTRGNARAYGLHDRGVLSPGYRADLNIIDFASLRLKPPRVLFDLPAGGRRLVQQAEGYLHTFVSGVETLRDDEFTGELPGRLIRGEQRAPDVPV